MLAGQRTQRTNTPGNNGEAGTDNTSPSAPAISLPKGGGAIRGIGEKFAANPVTGTGSMTVPIATSPGRSGFGPQLSLSYDSGAGNGPFGFGWSLSLPSITRKTDKGLPTYQDADESDVFILSGAEDLVPALIEKEDGKWEREPTLPRTINGTTYYIQRYRPRIEGLFARIERWTDVATGEIHWRSITRDNITTLYGKDNNSRIVDPADLDPARPARIFSWLICQSYDDKGNAIMYEYHSEDSQRIFEDAQGQSVAWAHERNRTDATRSANRHLKRIKYGNRMPNRDATTWQATDPAQLPTDTWMFEVVFDYGEGHYAAEAPAPQGRVFARAQIDPPAGSHWLVRQDPFSTYRAGFEVRTYRLCRRVLMFHHFPQELGINDCLVRSTEFSYAESPIASFITGITQSGYVRQPTQNQPDRYLKQSLPPLAFEYSQVPSPEQLAQQPIREVNAESLENLPVGLDGASYQWMDLDGEGTSGILTEQADGWYYKRNLSANNHVREDGQERTVAHFGPMELVASKPAVGLAGGAQFLDLAGDGQVDLVQMDGPLRGFYERSDDARWAPFQPFPSWPDLNTRDPDLKLVDLTGDGHADILITEGEALTWYPSLAEEGFGPAVRVSLPSDEEKGPRLVFADGLQSIYLADLSGDGLSDLVRIRNGEVCYWPNLGYGRFGAKVTMDNATWFDNSDQFDQRRIRLADTDGSGTTDLLYLRRDGVHIYFNQSGNRWREGVALPQFPPIDNISSVQALDLLGNGTACLVWSSPLPGTTPRPMRYLALMEEKPHLLIGVKNNLGAETQVQYAPSTKFYLDDKRNGETWITRLPFPVHVVERVETRDHISRNRFVTRYAYHHGYSDGVEREFRGFGMVEQLDTEEFAALTAGGTLPEATNIDVSSHVPPVLTRTWFHTGAFLDESRISRQFEHEYYRESDTSESLTGLTVEQLRALLLDDTVLPSTLRRADGTRTPYTPPTEEVVEACRALKGAILRQEIYALDGTDEADRPYSTSERNYTIELLQPRGGNKHAVFFTQAREQVDFHYERKLVEVDGQKRADPRVTHAMTLEVDSFGNALRSAAIGYRRRALPGVDAPEQQQTHLTLTVNRFANRASERDWYRIGVPVETRTYEIVKPTEPTITDTRIDLFRFEAIARLTADLFPVDQPEPGAAKLWPYEKWDWHKNSANAPADTRLRLVEHVRTLYRRDDLTGLLALGQVESLALPFESYKLAFTAELAQQLFVDSGKLAVAALNDALGDEGKYVHSEGDANWWIPAGRVFYSPGSNDPAVEEAEELEHARQHFFLPHRLRDPFHTDMLSTETVITYDKHKLLLLETRDALGNSLLSAMEKEDGEALAILRAKHERIVMEMVEHVRYAQLQEAIKSKEGLLKSLALAVQRYTYYERQLGKKPNEIVIPELDELDKASLEKMKFAMEELEVMPREIEVDITTGVFAQAAQFLNGGSILSSHEVRELLLLETAQLFSDTANILSVISSAAHTVPTFQINVQPMGTGGTTEFGGKNIGFGVEGAALAARAVADRLNFEARRADRIGSYARREQDWAFQSNLAAGEITQIFKQVRAAQIREAIAELELKNHRQQMKHAEEIERFLNEEGAEKTGKKANKALYTWMKREVQGLYAQCFQVAFDIAKKAERPLQHELGNSELNSLQFGYLAGKEGLLAGEKLYLDIKRMEMAYHDLNQREYELTKHVSLLQVNPLALLQLRTNGRCTVFLPEELFDMDGPGHYFRRIKSVAVSIPCVTGPYTSVNCTLTLLKSAIRKSALLRDGSYTRESAEDDRFSDHFGSLQAIVTSTGQNDSGLFETNLRDERYLPFEGSGVVSEWQLELPAEVRQFDYDTIADVILHLRYAAREGGGILRNGAVANLKTRIEEAQAAGSVRLFSMRHEFPSDWAKFKRVQLSDATPVAELTVNLREEHYPFWSRGRLEAVKHMDIFAKTAKDSVEITSQAGGAGNKDTLVKDTTLGNLRAGKLTNIPLPTPTGQFSLYFNDNSMEDVWLAVAWGKRG